MLYVLEVPEQTVELPETDPGVAGAVFTFTLTVFAADELHALFAVTVIFPPVVPAVAVIEFVVDIPVHSTGNVQV
jgi:hypothetical protein